MNVAEPPRVDAVDPRFRSFVPGNALVEPLLSGCRWLEGPVWFADLALLVVSDIPNDRLLRVTEAGEVSVLRQPAGFPNGNTRDLEGRLVSCSHLHRAVLRTEHDGRITTLADRYRGKRLNAPNDVVVRRDGSVWFTDPVYGLQTDYEGEKAIPELPPAVYRLDPTSGVLACVADDLEGPNGLAFSPDERRLYIAESGDQYAAEPRRHLRVYEVDGDALRGGRVFHTVEPGYADGFRCDDDGHVWTGAGDGIHCLHPSGALLGRIVLPSAVSNLCFGGRLRSRLFVCCGTALHVLTVNRRGAARP